MHVRCLCIFIYLHISFKSVLKLMYFIYVYTHICNHEEYMHIEKNCEHTHKYLFSCRNFTLNCFTLWIVEVWRKRSL